MSTQIVFRESVLVAALAFALIGCSSSEIKSEPFPDVPDDMKSGPGLFSGRSGEIDVVKLTTGEGADEDTDMSDFEAWKQSREEGSGDDLSGWLGEGEVSSSAGPPSSSAKIGDNSLENDKDYQEYLEYKRWKEYRDFQEWKRQQSQ